MAVTMTQLRNMALSLPGVEVRPCHGTLGFYAGKKLMARMQEDDEHLSLAFPKGERDALIDQHPDVFSYTDHFVKYDYVLMNLPAASAAVARRQFETAWRLRAPKRAVAAFDASNKR